MDIYLIRHGETDWNHMKKLQGTTDIPLNAYGIELAEKTAEGLKDVPFDRIYTSPLIRARKTAEIIRRDRPIEIIETDGLKEISFRIITPFPNPDFVNFLMIRNTMIHLLTERAFFI